MACVCLLCKQVFVDTVGPPESYQAKLTREFNGKIEFVVSPSATEIRMARNVRTRDSWCTRHSAYTRSNRPAWQTAVSRWLKRPTAFFLVLVLPASSPRSAYLISKPVSSFDDSWTWYAQVSRDYMLENWSFREPEARKQIHEFGCGYPSDEKTKTWLQKNLSPVPCVCMCVCCSSATWWYWNICSLWDHLTAQADRIVVDRFLDSLTLCGLVGLRQETYWKKKQSK